VAAAVESVLRDGSQKSPGGDAERGPRLRAREKMIVETPSHNLFRRGDERSASVLATGTGSGRYIVGAYWFPCSIERVFCFYSGTSWSGTPHNLEEREAQSYSAGRHLGHGKP